MGLHLSNFMNRKLKLWELNRPTVEEFKNNTKFPLVIILDNIRSLANVGTFFRTADAFNVSKIILGGITAQPPHREIQKTALGATESIDWEYQETVIDRIKELKKDGYRIYAIEQAENTTLLNEVKITNEERRVLIFGNEVDGVQQELVDFADVVLEVPQFGTKHSLNVSVCAGVVLWEFVRKKNRW
jgi:tRNA G18 (ribose-2'-O)-methylase SpoU